MIWRTLFRAGWGLLILLFVLSLCLWLVYSRRLQLDLENRKELAHAAHELGAILGELGTTADKYFIEFQKDESQPPATGARTAPGEDPLKRAESFQTRNPYIADRPLASYAKSTAQAEADSVAGCMNSGLPGPNLLAVPVKVKDEGRKVVLLPVSAEAIFDDVAISQAFEYLFIADQQGNVMFQIAHGASGQRRVDRPWLLRRAEGPTLDEHQPIRLEKLDALESGPGTKLKAEDLAASSGARPIRLGDQAYQLYSYPVPVTGFDPVGNKSSNKGTTCAREVTWIVGGLVDPWGTWVEALTISQEWMLLLFVAFVVAVVGQPFVKLFLLSPSERFRFADACLLVPSAAFLLVLATILLLDAATYGQLRSQTADGSKELARRVQANLSAEFAHLLTQLDTYDVALFRDLTSLCKTPDRTRILKPDDGSQPKPELQRPSYQNFVQVFWADSEGDQFFKASTHEVSTGIQNVSARPYFTEARDGRLWSAAKVFVQSLRSFTTGELTTVMSFRSNLNSTCPKPPPDDRPKEPTSKPAIVVAAIEARPLSVERPYLPIDLSFAVIESSGRVIYHSDRRRSLKENLFDELSDPARLQAAIYAGEEEYFSTTYARRPTEVFVQPFDGLPDAKWFVIAFRDEQWLETVNSEVLFKTITWSLVALVPVLVLPMILLVAGKECLKYFWPDSQREPFYKVLTGVYAGVFLVGVVGVWLLTGWWRFLLALGLPTFVVALTVALYVRHSPRQSSGGNSATSEPEKPSPSESGRSRTDQSDGDDDYRQAHFLAVASCWACIAVVPAIGLFCHSWNLELAKVGQLERQRAMEHRDSWIAQDAAQANRIAVENHQDFLIARQRFLADYKPSLPKTGRTLWPDQELDTWLPIYNESVERLRYQNPQGTGQAVSGGLPGYVGAGLAFNWMTALGALLTGLVAWWWLQYKERHLLWSHLARRRATRELKELVTQRRFVSIQAPSHRERLTVAKLFASGSMSGRAAAYNRQPAAEGASVEAGPRPVAVAMAVPAASAETLSTEVNAALSELPAMLVPDGVKGAAASADRKPSAPKQDNDESRSGTVITLVDDFENMILADDRRNQTLELLEDIVATTEKSVVIVSRTDPLLFVTGAKELGADILKLRPDLPSAERERWLRVLESFVTHVSRLSETSRDGNGGGKRRNLLNRVLFHSDRAPTRDNESYFDSLWRYCTEPEQLTLIHVAEEGFANPHLNTVERLVDKGLLVFEPNLKLMSQEFEDFVRLKAASVPVKKWESAHGTFGWARARWIFALLILAALILLVMAQGAWFKGAAALLTSVAAALETISQLLRATQQTRQALVE